MEHTDFRLKYKKLKEKALKELMKCLKAHGGKYTFDEYKDLRPCVNIMFTDYKGSGYVTKVEIVKNSVITKVIDLPTGTNEYCRYAHNMDIQEIDDICTCLPEPIKE